MQQVLKVCVKYLSERKEERLVIRSSLSALPAFAGSVGQHGSGNVFCEGCNACNKYLVLCRALHGTHTYKKVEFTVDEGMRIAELLSR